MSIEAAAAAVPTVPDYELAPTVVVDGPAQIKAMVDPLRASLLDLVLERAATVAELAAAVRRPKSTVAYHVGVLVDAGLLRVVRTRRVKAIDECFYGRTGRTIVVGDGPGTGATGDVRVDFVATAHAEMIPEIGAMATLRHARIPTERAEEFFDRLKELAADFTRLPRGGDRVYGFVCAVYETDLPILPEPSR